MCVLFFFNKNHFFSLLFTGVGYRALLYHSRHCTNSPSAVVILAVVVRKMCLLGGASIAGCMLRLVGVCIPLPAPNPRDGTKQQISVGRHVKE